MGPVASSGTEPRQFFHLGQVAPTSKLRFEAENATGQWSWNVRVSDQVGRSKTTIFEEKQSGGDADASRVGLIRRVVISPTGMPLESCGEMLAQMTCIPIDSDGDGSALGAGDCNDNDPANRAGNP